MLKNFFLYSFIFIASLCLSIEFELDWEYNLPTGPGSIFSSWVADIDSDQNQEIYLATSHSMGQISWRINSIEIDGEITFAERSYQLPDNVLIQACEYFQEDNECFLATLAKSNIDDEQLFHLVVNDFVTDTLIDSLEIEMSDQYDSRYLSFVKSYILNDIRYIFVGEKVYYSIDRGESFGFSLLHIFVFDGEDLELIDTIDNNGYKLYFNENENHLISIGKNSHSSGEWWCWSSNWTYFINEFSLDNLSYETLETITSGYSGNDEEGNIYNNSIMSISLISYDETGLLFQKTIFDGSDFYGDFTSNFQFQKYNNEFEEIYITEVSSNNIQNFLSGKKIFYQGNNYILYFTTNNPGNESKVNLLDYDTGEIVLSEDTEISEHDLFILETYTEELKVFAYFGYQNYRLYSIISLESFTTPNTIPVVSSKMQNFPNPFNPTTTISFSIPEESKVELSIYNIKGQKIKSLLNNQITAGEHSIVWNGKDASGKKVGSGLYLYKLKVNDKTELVKKCLLLK